jgi:hypothetical protein
MSQADYSWAVDGSASSMPPPLFRALFLLAAQLDVLVAQIAHACGSTGEQRYGRA